jgi:diketogulonate reductase-like aldo/keto reductase
VIPKSSNPDRVRENAELFTLTQEEINEIDALNKDKRYNDPSGRFKYQLYQ